MKAISELENFVDEPTGDEYFILNQKLANGTYKSFKVTLNSIMDFINQGNLITEDGIDIALCDGNNTLIACD